MNVNKKLDRFKQWAGERMGGEIKTNTSDDFKALEAEMGLRQDGVDKIQRSMHGYIKAISKRSEIEGKEKILPVAHLGATMLAHGEDFEIDSEYGQCLSTFGRSQERLARSQESFITAATSTWLEALEKTSVQMKEYQAARRRLEARRLAYDTSLGKMQKAKREDFRVEDELRSQKAKYEEAEDDVYRRMMEIRDAEADSIADLTAFLEAQLTYHDRCREALQQLRDDWPAKQIAARQDTRNVIRSRSNTARSFAAHENLEPIQPAVEARPAIRSRVPSSRFNPQVAADIEASRSPRPGITRSTTYDSAGSSSRDLTPIQLPLMTRVPSDSMTQKPRYLRPVDQNAQDQDVFADSPSQQSFHDGDHQFSDYADSITGSARKGPPPPPPSRAKKPPPPPPPAKRTLYT